MTTIKSNTRINKKLAIDHIKKALSNNTQCLFVGQKKFNH